MRSRLIPLLALLLITTMPVHPASAQTFLAQAFITSFREARTLTDRRGRAALAAVGPARQTVQHVVAQPPGNAENKEKGTLKPTVGAKGKDCS